MGLGKELKIYILKIMEFEKRHNNKDNGKHCLFYFGLK
jgi:hypothetical protein